MQTRWPAATPARECVEPAPGVVPTVKATRSLESHLETYFSLVRAVPGRRVRQVLVCHPWASVVAFRNLLALPVLTARLSEGAEGLAVRRALQARLAPWVTVGQPCNAVLSIPETAAAYSDGPRKQTLRRKVRKARKAGTSCRAVTDQGERRELVDRLDTRLSLKKDQQHRWSGTDHRLLLSRRLWLVAEDDAGTPLVVCIVPVDGRWALLEYFMALGDGPQYSDARYLLTQALVEELSRLGVRFLVDTMSPFHLPTGLRHFQGMLGFGLARVKVRAA